MLLIYWKIPMEKLEYFLIPATAAYFNAFHGCRTEKEVNCKLRVEGRWLLLLRKECLEKPRFLLFVLRFYRKWMHRCINICRSLSLPSTGFDESFRESFCLPWNRSLGSNHRDRLKMCVRTRLARGFRVYIYIYIFGGYISESGCVCECVCVCVCVCTFLCNVLMFCIECINKYKINAS